MLNIPQLDNRIKTLIDKTPGFMPEDEGLALYVISYVASAMKLGPVIEIGTYCGKSTLYIAAAAKYFDNQVLTIDHHRGSEEMQAGWEHHDPTFFDPLTGKLETLLAFRTTWTLSKLENIIAIIGDSVKVANSISVSASLVFIDGGHGLEPAFNDYRNWAPKIANNGFLAIHDVFENPLEGGDAPYKVFQEAINSKGFLPIAKVGSLRVLKKVAN